MMTKNEKLILLTNDDGIRSPGLWAAAEGLSKLGFVVVAAPREQSSGAGRSMPIESDGRLTEEQVTVGGKTWKVYAVGGSPAQAVQHGILELLPRCPDLVVAGINYGENLTVGVTISGTVGAALEGAAAGVPALAVSLEMSQQDFLSYSETVDFSAATYFTCHFASRLLEMPSSPDVDVLKVDVPRDATPETPWVMTRLSRQKYYIPKAPRRTDLGESVKIGYDVVLDETNLEPDSDVYAICVARKVSVTPLSLDLTSRAEFNEIERILRAAPGQC
ncbi:MAG: 5'/3'-nucleotidase SurE [Anaerolineales bacterium]|nr:5'/3'-nucleotidase SurE [Anaerolineales bacterium]